MRRAKIDRSAAQGIVDIFGHTLPELRALISFQEAALKIAESVK